MWSGSGRLCLQRCSVTSVQTDTLVSMVLNPKLKRMTGFIAAKMLTFLQTANTLIWNEGMHIMAKCFRSNLAEKHLSMSPVACLGTLQHLFCNFANISHAAMAFLERSIVPATPTNKLKQFSMILIVLSKPITCKLKPTSSQIKFLCTFLSLFGITALYCTGELHCLSLGLI